MVGETLFAAPLFFGKFAVLFMRLCVTGLQGTLIFRRLNSAPPDAARGAFDAVYSTLPGELAPKLALAFAAEAAGDNAAASRYFQLVWTVDHSYVSAAFGLARTRLEADDRPGAVAALTAVSETSSHYLAAQVAAVRIQILDRRDQARAAATDLRDASGRLAPAQARQRAARAAHRRGAAGGAGQRHRRRAAGWRRAAGLRAQRASAALRPGAQLPGPGPAGARPAAPDRAGRHGQRRAPADLAMTGAAATSCPSCGRAVSQEDNFCEACRAELSPAVTSGYQVAGVAAAACPFDPGAKVTPEGYCESCGRRVPSSRDHTELNLGTLAGVSDRGLRHHQNEDAMALATAADEDGAVALAVVCDGVSSSSRPADASLEAAQAAMRVLLAAVRTGAEVAEASANAVSAAQKAVAGLKGPPGDSPSATYVSGVLTSDKAVLCWLGDSRAYWLGPDGTSQKLTTDDSLAEEMVATGLLARRRTRWPRRTPTS